mgnify:FL=1
MEELIVFYKKIPKSKELKPSELIPYFAYYLETVNGIITAKDILQCFEILTLPGYSGVSTYLIRQSDKKIGKFIKQKNGYKLNRIYKEEIASSLNEVVDVPLTTNFFDVNLLKNTQYYLVNTASQMCKCYDSGLYDAALVLMRKLLETLIVETFERFGIEDAIKDVNGNYKFLSSLIPRLI